jgi:hypothetical protein
MYPMKTLVTKLTGAGLSLSGITVAALLAAGSVQTSYAASADPSGGGSLTWDLVSSGSGQRGIALITFNVDNTFRGYQMLAAIPPNTNSTGGARGGGGVGRGTSGSGGTTNSFFFGFSPIDGNWAQNSKGQIVGFFSEAINVTSTVTNFLASTNTEHILNSQAPESTDILVVFTNGQATATVSFDWADPAPGHTDIYTFANQNTTIGVGSAQTTNVVSFLGKVSGKHMTLLSNTTFGKTTFKGVPSVPALDISGNWIGSKRENGLESSEFFSLVSFSQDNPFPADFPDIANFPNVFFTTNGVGPGYGFTGVAIFSQQKTVGFTFFKDDGTMRATIGKLKVTKFGPTANTEGIDEPLNRVNFSATLQ